MAMDNLTLVIIIIHYLYIYIYCHRGITIAMCDYWWQTSQTIGYYLQVWYDSKWLLSAQVVLEA